MGESKSKTTETITVKSLPESQPQTSIPAQKEQLLRSHTVLNNTGLYLSAWHCWLLALFSCPRQYAQSDTRGWKYYLWLPKGLLLPQCFILAGLIVQIWAIFKVWYVGIFDDCYSGHCPGYHQNFTLISSDGHLEIAKYILGDKSSGMDSLELTVLLHIATTLSICYVFREK